MLDPTLYEWWAPSLFLKSYVRIEETKPIGFFYTTCQNISHKLSMCNFINGSFISVTLFVSYPGFGLYADIIDVNHALRVCHKLSL